MARWPGRQPTAFLSLLLLGAMANYCAAQSAGRAPFAKHEQAVTPESRAEPNADSPSRTLWTSSRVVGFPDPALPFKLVPAFPNLKIPKLITLSAVPKTSWILAADHQSDYGGPSRVVQFLDQADVSETELFLERPEIIYGFAFHPQFATNRFVYVGCNGRSEALGTVATRVLRFRVDGTGPFRCDPASEEVIIEWESNGHNGGDLVFGNDGMLYISAGDGTSDSDVARNGQNLSTLNAAMLRVDVDHSTDSAAYRIPRDNPFVHVPGARGEIWAYGLRNPWRITYDPPSDQLWVGNNGQDWWESVYLIQRGANYGWSINESNHPFHTNQDHGPAEISLATFEHHHSEARSLTGGRVYRGTEFPDFVGAYIYGDYSTGNIWAIRHDGQEVTFQNWIARSRVQISSFGIDSRGEILIADHAGAIFRFAPNIAQVQPEFPRRLTQTGLFADTARGIPAPGLISYSVNSPLWSDGAVKRRWIAIPGEATIDFKPRGTWGLPNGTVIVKEFSFPNGLAGEQRRVETRLLHRQNGEWYGYSYRWNASQTDAELVDSGGRDESLDWVMEDSQAINVQWHYPSRSECMVCHTRASEFVLGLSSEQMNKSHAYDGPSDPMLHVVPQLRALHQLGYFGESSANADFDSLQRLVNPADESQPIEMRARSYLHANCASCHIEAGGGNSKIALDFFKPLEKMNLVDAAPLHSNLGNDSAKIIASGNPDRSILLARMARRGESQMPPLGTHRVDAFGVSLIGEWIRSLSPEKD
jgi:uncharacterized repeat protein (TIGR03806 family)